MFVMLVGYENSRVNSDWHYVKVELIQNVEDAMKIYERGAWAND